jgi:hypothetical protein
MYVFVAIKTIIRTSAKLKIVIVCCSNFQQLVHYTMEKYAKRLIGNAYSIPVLEELLKPLCEVYDKATYVECNYPYAWENKAI